MLKKKSCAPTAASHFCHAHKHPTNPIALNRNAKRRVESVGWTKNGSRTSFFGITNPELKRHGWSVTRTIGAKTVKRTLTTLSATGPGNVHRFPHQNSLMGSIAFAQSARSHLQRVTRGLLKLHLCVRNVPAKTTLAKR